MVEMFYSWFSANYIELLGTILGLLYIFFSIKQHIFTWPTGLLTSALYVYVFFQSKLYADMGLQMYYVLISVYGWYFWLKGGSNNGKQEAPVVRAPKKLYAILALASVVIYVAIYLILSNFTDSPVPHMDSLTTSLSIIATWMLARKMIEHWLIWIFVDAFSIGLYIYKDLWSTTVLFAVYTVMAYIGYRQWIKTCTVVEAAADTGRIHVGAVSLFTLLHTG